MRYMAEHLGAWQVGDNRTRGHAEFKIFFPGKDFQAVDRSTQQLRWELDGRRQQPPAQYRRGRLLGPYFL